MLVSCNRINESEGYEVNNELIHSNLSYPGTVAWRVPGTGTGTGTVPDLRDTMASTYAILKCLIDISRFIQKSKLMLFGLSRI